MKIIILFGYWKIFLLEIWVLVPIAQNFKDQMQIYVTRREKAMASNGNKLGPT